MSGIRLVHDNLLYFLNFRPFGHTVGIHCFLLRYFDAIFCTPGGGGVRAGLKYIDISTDAADAAIWFGSEAGRAFQSCLLLVMNPDGKNSKSACMCVFLPGFMSKNCLTTYSRKELDEWHDC